MFINTNKQIISGKNEIILNKIQKDSLCELKIEISSDTIIPENEELIIYVDNNSSKNQTLNRKEYIVHLNDYQNSFMKAGDEITLNILNNESLVAPSIDNTKDTNQTLDENRNILSSNLGIELFDDTSYIYTNYENAIITLAYNDNENVINALNEEENAIQENSDFSLDDIYFKDAFTQTGDKLNLEVNNANIDCLLSRNNKFSLDSNGNLIVNSITTNSGNNQLTKQDICNFIYPIGSIYMSQNNTSPATLFGGTWVRINGYYLYAGTGGTTAGSNTSGGSNGVTGGANGNTSSTVLSTSQLPNNILIDRGAKSSITAGEFGANYVWQNKGSANEYWLGNNNTSNGQGHTHTLNNHTHSLNNHTHSVTPLRYEVYAWRRTA